MTDDEIRDADGCEDYESLEESGLRTGDAPAQPAADEDDAPYAETDDGEPDTEPEDPLLAELAAVNDKYMRLFAEFDNFRKRTAKEKSETYLDAVAKTVGELLPVIDSFERAMTASCSDDAYRTGMERIYEQLAGILKQLGVSEIPGVGEAFDPKIHNAIQQVQSEDFEEGKVCTVYQKGYRLGERIIRCAMVAVVS